MLENNDLKILDTIHESSYKVPRSLVSHGEYLGSEVIVKQGGEGLSREADILRTIDDPRIPKVIEYQELLDGVQVLILNKLQGTPLDQLIQLQADWSSSPIGLPRVIEIVEGLTGCFTALKNAGYLYRDLNLGHILVDGDQVNLVDHEWDVRLDQSNKARADNAAGTWETMAPEEYEVGNDMSEASNIYTLGTVLLQLVTGRSPFYISKADISEAELRRMATLELMKSFSGVKTGNDHLDTVINMSLDFNPEERFQSLEDFSRALAS